jgi:hypothetical protein
MKSTRPRAEPLPLEPDMVHYMAARSTTAAELLDEVLGEAFTADKEANLIFRDALMLLVLDESRRLKAEAHSALKGKESAGMTRTGKPEARGLLQQFVGAGKEDG